MTIQLGAGEWLALPPRYDPEALAALYREAYLHVVSDPDFVERSKRMADDFTPVSHADVESWIKIMSRTPPEALEFISTMIRGQGLKLDQ